MDSYLQGIVATAIGKINAYDYVKPEQVFGYTGVYDTYYYGNAKYTSAVLDDPASSNDCYYQSFSGDHTDQVAMAMADGKGHLDNYMYGGDGSDIILGGSGDDRIESGYGDDIVLASGGNNTVVVGNGDNLVVAGFKFEYASGANFVEYLQEFLARPNAEVQDVGGNNLIFGANYNDYVITGRGNDTVYGDLIDGGPFAHGGSDTIYSGAGHDFLIGGGANDVLAGQDGNDTYIYNAGDGVDVIGEYATPGAGTADKVVMNGIPLSSIGIGQMGTDLIITNGSEGMILDRWFAGAEYQGMESLWVQVGDSSQYNTFVIKDLVASLTTTKSSTSSYSDSFDGFVSIDLVGVESTIVAGEVFA